MRDVAWRRRIVIGTVLIARVMPGCALDRIALGGGPSDDASMQPARDASFDAGGAIDDDDAGFDGGDGDDGGGSEDAALDADLDGGFDAGLYETHVIECESGVLHGQMELAASAEASGGSYTEDTRGGTWDANGSALPPDRVDLSITITDPGPFYLWVRLYTIDGSQDATYAGFAASDLRRLFHDDHGTWQWVSNPTSLRFDGLAPGPHVLSIGGGEPGPRCDRVVLTNDPAFDPTTLP